MENAIRYALQFLAGVGMFACSNRLYFLIWEYYARGFPRPYEAQEIIETRTLALMCFLFVIYQFVAYLGMRALLRCYKVS